MLIVPHANLTISLISVHQPANYVMVLLNASPVSPPILLSVKAVPQDSTSPSMENVCPVLPSVKAAIMAQFVLVSPPLMVNSSLKSMINQFSLYVIKGVKHVPHLHLSAVSSVFQDILLLLEPTTMSLIAKPAHLTVKHAQLMLLTPVPHVSTATFSTMEPA